MSKPEDIPQDVWDAAWNVEVVADFSFDGQTGGTREQHETAENIARAIMAATLEEREACAVIASDYSGSGMVVGGDTGSAHQTKKDIAAAIRNRAQP